MGFPFEPASWDGVSGAIFMGAGGAMPGLYALIGIVICVGALLLGNIKEHKYYAPHK